MSLQFLLDTNVLSEPAKRDPHPAVLRRLEAHAQDLATCSIVWHELLYGAARLPRSRRRTTLETYLVDVIEATLPILSYDADAARWHAEERARLERVGRQVGFADGQIAAVAAVNGLTLVTANTRDFKVFRGVRTVDWSKP
jgi:tRNA(fMet)-specific endonuclease VapC